MNFKAAWKALWDDKANLQVAFRGSSLEKLKAMPTERHGDAIRSIIALAEDTFGDQLPKRIDLVIKLEFEEQQ